MALTRDYKETVINRLKDDEQMRVSVLDEAIEAFMSGEHALGKELLKDLIHATIGFEQLAVIAGKNSKSLHRMLSDNGNPTITNFFIIIAALISFLGARIEIKCASNNLA